MKGLLRFAVLAASVVVFGACQDTEVRQWLNDYYDYDSRVWNALCQLERDVYDVADSAGDTRVAGNSGNDRFCPGGTDPVGRPDPPPQV
jgi:hypothetical protein